MASAPENWSALLDSSSSIPTDVTFEVIEKKDDDLQSYFFDVHKIVLAVASSVFQAEFFGSAKETTERIVVEDTTRDAFETMINYVYLKDIDLEDFEMDKLYDLVNLAEKYELKGLMRILVDHLAKLSPKCEEMVMNIMLLADTFHGFDEASKALQRDCARFMLRQTLKSINDVAVFTSKHCEDGRSSVALKLINVIKNISEEKMTVNAGRKEKEPPTTSQRRNERSRNSKSSLARKSCLCVLIFLGSGVFFLMIMLVLGLLVYSILHICCNDPY